MRFWTILAVAVGIATVWVVGQHIRQTTRIERKIDAMVLSEES